MKKFLISLFIVAVFSVVIFFIGWTQIKVKSDQVGVVFSKTSGISEDAVVPGKFSWNWQFLLPGNAQLRTFTIKPYNSTKVYSGELPSGGLFSSESENFGYRFSYTIGMTVSPQQIVALLKQNKIYDEKDLNDYMNGAADTIAQLASEYLLKKAEENPSFRAESVRREDILRSIRIYNDYPEIDLTAFAITEAKIPDFKLYSKMQTQVTFNQDKLFQNQTTSDEQNESEILSE
ncbi:MAG: hypothetical protein SPE59_09200 [Treponema sp.]|nr:hypothetical protein [Treponema sp.]